MKPKSNRTFRAGLICAIATLFGGAQLASAATILDTIQGLPFDTGASGWALQNDGSSGQSLGLEFTLVSPMTITGVQAYAFSEFANGRANFGIRADAGGVPSGSFISGDVTLVALSETAPVNLTSLSWSLSAGTYWLVAVAIDFEQGGWQANGPAGPFAIGNATGDGTWFNSPLDDSPPMALITGEDVSATPLPATLPLFATGLGGLGLLGWRRKKKAAALAA